MKDRWCTECKCVANSVCVTREHKTVDLEELAKRCEFLEETIESMREAAGHIEHAAKWLRNMPSEDDIELARKICQRPETAETIRRLDAAAASDE